MLRIVHYPHPVLRYTSRPLTEIDDSLRGIVREMFDLMYEARGVGLAANQVGLPFRLFVLNVTADPEQKDKELVFINPEIIKRHSSIEDEEGCLSLPGIHGDVRRARKIKLQAYDLRGELVTHDAEDLFSRAAQHEIDHLDGKLFIDHLSLLAKHGIKDKLREFEARYLQAQSVGEIPGDAEIGKILDAMERPSSAPFEANATSA
ncbi:peptide deformylase [Aquisphaera insulae]|uniref:peptide deformylase n=1 Tax=Aquisphaera insulae TaxID=2712864 RepID=UPI0013EA080E|nr:peptide deformylase [Aquisphaera insulae]